MTEQIYVAWDRLDPLGTQLGVLSDASAKASYIAFDGPGSGVFTISRHSAQAAWCRTGTYVRVHLESTANDPVFAFFIEEGQDVVVSAQEEGGEDWRRGGRGALTYLERAIVDHVQRTANAFSIDTETAELVWQDKKVGRILKDLIEEAQARSPDPLADLTYTWTATTDSAGNTFDTVDGDFRVPIGLDLLAAIETLRGQGLSVAMTPDLELLAYQDYTYPLRAITFAKGVNIREAAERAIHASPAKSRLLVQGTRKNGTLVWKTVVDTEVDDDIGPHEGFMRYERTATVARLEKAGLKRLRALKRSSDGLTTVGVTVGDGTSGPRGTGEGHYVPFTHYWPGDRVTIDVPGEYDELVQPIDVVVLTDQEAGEYDPAIQFNVPNYNPAVGEPSAGGGRDFALPPDLTGDGGGGAPAEAAELETVACTGEPIPRLHSRKFSRVTSWAVDYGYQANGVTPHVQSAVYYNVPWTGTACGIGPGAFEGYSDEETWFEFTAPADSDEYLGLLVTFDATGVWETGFGGAGYRGGVAYGPASAGQYGEASGGLSLPGPGTTGQVYVPRSLVQWGQTMSLVVSPDWLCDRSAYFCSPYFDFPVIYGWGASGQMVGFDVSEVCAVRYVAGQENKLSGEVAALGAVDGVNRTFQLINWDGSGYPELTINGLEQPSAGIIFNRTTGTATLEGPPPAGSVVLWNYVVGTLAGTITLTPDPAAVVLVVPNVSIPEDIELLPDPAGVLLVATEPTIS